MFFIFILNSCCSNLSGDLLRAASEGKVGEVKSLLARGADPNTRENVTFLTTVIANEDKYSEADLKKVMDSLIEKGAQADGLYTLSEAEMSSITPLMYAAIHDSINSAKNLIEVGVDVNAIDNKGRTALIWASKSGSAKVTEELLKNTKVDKTIKDSAELTAEDYATVDTIDLFSA